jgi:hypothetical protein
MFSLVNWWQDRSKRERATCIYLIIWVAMQPNHHRSDLTGEAVTASHRREILHRNAPSIHFFFWHGRNEHRGWRVGRRRGPAVKKIRAQPPEESRRVWLYAQSELDRDGRASPAILRTASEWEARSQRCRSIAWRARTASRRRGRQRAAMWTAAGSEEESFRLLVSVRGKALCDLSRLLLNESWVLWCASGN